MRGDVPAFLDVLRHGSSVGAQARAGTLTITGDMGRAEEFFAMFEGGST
ncbi:hypothetical protein AB0910_20740 [Streptomyces sp. NPDC047002]